jgi:hypothetical protein
MHLEIIGGSAISKAHAQEVHMLTTKKSSAIYASTYLSYLIKSGVQEVGLILGTWITKIYIYIRRNIFTCPKICIKCTRTNTTTTSEHATPHATPHCQINIAHRSTCSILKIKQIQDSHRCKFIMVQPANES